MPLNLKALTLDPDPASVKEARDWVRHVLARLHREDIIDAAELGVSELVTNAILHGTPPITVRVRGTRQHPRVEVRDSSKRPPEVNIAMADEDRLLATFGRGLGLVALHSSAWGAELAPEGKVVWFEPTDEPRLDDDLTGEVFDLDQTLQERLDASGLPESFIRVRLLDVPVRILARFRQRYYELGRELRLLALAHGDTYPVARELTEVFLQIEQEARVIRGVDTLRQAIADDLERIDIDLFVPERNPATVARLLDTLERVDEFCREQRLLVLAATPQIAEFQRWYFGEWARQAAGEEPRPWAGSFKVEDEPTAG